MTPDEIRKLMGSYATGGLTDEERDRLFAAALKDQSLFDALAEEEALRDLIAQPGVRAELLQELAPKRSLLGSWWFAAGAFAVVLIVLGVGIEFLRRPAERLEIAVNVPEAKVPETSTQDKIATAKQPLPRAVTPSAPLKPPVPNLSRQTDATQAGGRVPEPAPAAADEKRAEPIEIPALQKAVEAAQKKAEALAVQKAEALADKAKETVPAVAQETDRSASRAPIGAGFTPPAPASPSPTRALGAFAARPAGGRVQALNAKVTDLNGTIVSLDAGTDAGLKIGDRLEVLRDGRVIVTIRITQIGATFAAGAMEGAASESPKAGDLTRRALTPLLVPPPQ
jgi:hypothetical protein